MIVDAVVPVDFILIIYEESKKDPLVTSVKVRASKRLKLSIHTQPRG